MSDEQLRDELYRELCEKLREHHDFEATSDSQLLAMALNEAEFRIFAEMWTIHQSRHYSDQIGLYAPSRCVVCKPQITTMAEPPLPFGHLCLLRDDDLEPDLDELSRLDTEGKMARTEFSLMEFAPEPEFVKGFGIFVIAETEPAGLEYRLPLANVVATPSEDRIKAIDDFFRAKGTNISGVIMLITRNPEEDQKIELHLVPTAAVINDTERSAHERFQAQGGAVKLVVSSERLKKLSQDNKGFIGDPSATKLMLVVRKYFITFGAETWASLNANWGNTNPGLELSSANPIPDETGEPFVLSNLEGLWVDERGPFEENMTFDSPT